MCFLGTLHMKQTNWPRYPEPEVREGFIQGVEVRLWATSVFSWLCHCLQSPPVSAAVPVHAGHRSDHHPHLALLPPGWRVTLLLPSPGFCPSSLQAPGQCCAAQPCPSPHRGSSSSPLSCGCDAGRVFSGAAASPLFWISVPSFSFMWFSVFSSFLK